MKKLLACSLLFLTLTSCDSDNNESASSASGEQEQLKNKINQTQEKVTQAKKEVEKEEERLKQDPSNEQIKKELQQAKQALLETEQKLQTAKQALEETKKPVVCARQVTESEYPCSAVCTDINKVHEFFQRYFYCMESNNYEHNQKAKSCRDTYEKLFRTASSRTNRFYLLNDLISSSHATNMGFASTVLNYTQTYHNAPNTFRYVAKEGLGSVFSNDTNTRKLCSDWDTSSVDGEMFFKCAKKIMQYYVNENKKKLKCWLY
ncbi:MAG: hypothetical protein OXJ52_03455 [Oligoflexia bacterium]|nr:hypothetical protein [Oligoflexia bacterium]